MAALSRPGPVAARLAAASAEAGEQDQADDHEQHAERDRAVGSGPRLHPRGDTGEHRDAQRHRHEGQPGLGRRETERNALWTGITLVMSEPGFNPEVPADERAELQRRSQIELAMLPAAKYPRLVECAAPMTACDDPEFHYRFGIGLFIDGIKAAARS